MHMGGMKFKQRGREEQAEADGTEVCVIIFYYTVITIIIIIQFHKYLFKPSVLLFQVLDFLV